MKRKAFLVFLVFLVFVSFCHADPPFQQSFEEAGISIDYPKNDYFLQGREIELHFHVFNSTGYILDNTTTSCLIHIYNETGDHVVEENLLMDSNGIDFYYLLPSTMTQERKDYAYILHCNNSKQAGWISTTFTIGRGDYNESNIGGMPLAIIIAIPLIIGIFFLLVSFNLGEEHTGLKLVLMLGSFMPFFASMHMAMLTLIRYYEFTALEELIGTTTYWLGAVLAVLFFYLLVYIFYKSIMMINERKKERLNY